MSTIQMRKFKSVWDGIKRFAVIFSGPPLIATFIKTDSRFREKLLMIVSLTNNCFT